MRGRKQNIDTLSDQSVLRVEPDVMIGMQTFMGITETHLTAFKHEKGGLLEYILSPSNLNLAYKQVKSNKGSGGIDRMEVDDLLPYLLCHKDELIASINAGKYHPNPVRRVEIPKSNGKKRNLGIPTVVDRLIQQAISQVLQPLYEPQFSLTSYGFRPHRSVHVAYMRDIKFLSYAFGRSNGKCQFYIHGDSIKKMKSKIRELTSRNNGWGYEYRKQRLTWYIRGWLNYFKLAGLKGRIKEWDSWLRRRIWMCIWKSWKRVRTRYRNLKKLISDENRVRMAAFCRKKYWRMASHPTVHEALSDERLLRAGYPTFKMYRHPVFKG